MHCFIKSQNQHVIFKRRPHGIQDLIALVDIQINIAFSHQIAGRIHLNDWI